MSGAGLRAQGATRASDDWVERVRAASEIAEVIGQSVSLKRVGRNWMGLCPFHQERTPSFSVNAERQFYHCFSCKAGGDVFKFVQETEKVGFLEAVELLSRRAGIPIPERRAGERGRRAPLLEALEAAATAYEQWLGDPSQGAAARAYLERRGITRETIRDFRLGVGPPGWDPLVRRLGERVPAEVLVEAGLAVRREGGGPGRGGHYDRFRQRLMVPLVAPGGAVLGFGARALAEGDEPKYLNSAESPVYHKGSFLFAMEQARRNVQPGGEVIVVEGYFDAIAMHQAGLEHAVATSGTALTTDQARLLKRMASRVALTYDGDRAGQEAMMRSLRTLLAEGLDVVVVDLPPGEDPDTLVRRGGLAAWSEARRSAADPVAFIQRHTLRANLAGDPRERALQAVVGLAAEVRDPIRLRLLIERAGQVFGFPETVLTRAVALKRGGEGTERPLQGAVREQRRAEEGLERRLLQALLLAPGAITEARARLSAEDFRDPACAALALELWSGGEPPADAGAAALARELTASGDPELNWAAEARGATRMMIERRLKQQLKDRQQRLDQTPAPAPDEAARLLQEIDDIARALRDLST